MTIENTALSFRGLCLFTECHKKNSCDHPYEDIKVEISTDHGGCIKFTCPHWKQES